MPYIRRTDAEPLSPSTVELLGRVAGLALPADDLDELARALTDQLASIDALERLDLTNVDPILQFDPRWPDHG